MIGGGNFMDGFSQNLSFYYLNSMIRYYGPNIINVVINNFSTENVNTKIYDSKLEYNNGLLCNYLNLLK